MFLEKGANPNQGRVHEPGGSNILPIHDAVLFGHPKIVELLVKHGADLDALSRENRTDVTGYAKIHLFRPLHYAVSARYRHNDISDFSYPVRVRMEIARILLEHNANPNNSGSQVQHSN
jgi:ankyrin repeat protein